MRAARKCDVTVMKLLLEAGADPKVAQKSGNTALMWRPERQLGRRRDSAHLRGPGTRGNQGRHCRRLDVNEANAMGDTVMHTAATANGGLLSVIGLLVESGARLDVRNNAGRTPLEAAERVRQPHDAAIALLPEFTAAQ